MKPVATAVLGLCLAAGAGAATFTVTNTNDSGAGSLRKAIDDANTAAGLDTIAFNVSGAGCNGSGVCTIAPTTQLPLLSSPVLIDGYTQPGSSPNTVAQGALNTVLKIVLSGASIPGQYGLYITDTADGSTIRGLVVNGGFNYGITSFFSDGNTVRGCFVGVDAVGTTKSPTVWGIDAEFSNDFTVGGPAPADRNLVSGQTQTNIQIISSADSTVEGNLIGPDISGAVALGPTLDCLFVATNTQGAVIRGNVVGGATVGMNLGNTADAITGMTVQGNWVGTDVTETADIGNLFAGIFIQGRGITIGGVGAGEGNVIAFNDGAGVLVSYAFAFVNSNTIRGNSIYSNGEGTILQGNSTLGIDLGNPGGFGEGGLTLNDLDDADMGPNFSQNFPILTSAVSAGGNTTVHGRFNSTPSSEFSIDFYVNDACVGRPQDYLEGKQYVGTAPLTTDGGGDASIDVVLSGVTLQAGQTVTATATDVNGNTSEFSQRIVVSATPSSANAPGNTSITLAGFHFLPGATATVGGLPATNVVVTNYNQVTLTTPSLPAGSLNDITVTNSDTSAGTLPNGWIVNFLDVPESQTFNLFVNTLVRNEITVGVGGGNYGVAQNTLRQQMAVFLLKAKYGICYTPPPCTVQVFPDVPCSSNFAPWINELVAQGITSGCGGGNYCPTNAVNRQQMAVFLLKTLEGSGYTPPDCSAATFSDVPCSHPFADWIYELVNRNITAGCGGGNYCPLTNANRGQMATFVVKTFGLQ
jgi:IPT/TIG domain/S-layer homology domain